MNEDDYVHDLLTGYIVKIVKKVESNPSYWVVSNDFLQGIRFIDEITTKIYCEEDSDV